MSYSWDEVQQYYSQLIEEVNLTPIGCRTLLDVWREEILINAHGMLKLIPVLREELSDTDYHIGLAHQTLFVANTRDISRKSIHIECISSNLFQIWIDDIDGINDNHLYKVEFKNIKSVFLSYVTEFLL